MDKLTAYRSFARPDYSPAKGKVRIYKDRWYIVTMQNVERDSMTDYHGLAAGTYKELVPGKEARERRDARLNHCNDVAEYRGAVFALERIEWSHQMETAYYPSQAEADAEGHKWATGRLAWYVEGLRRQIARYQRDAAKTRAEFEAGSRAGSFEQMRDLSAEWAENAQRQLDACGPDTFRYTVARIR